MALEQGFAIRATQGRQTKEQRLVALTELDHKDEQTAIAEALSYVPIAEELAKVGKLTDELKQQIQAAALEPLERRAATLDQRRALARTELEKLGQRRPRQVARLAAQLSQIRGGDDLMSQVLPGLEARFNAAFAMTPATPAETGTATGEQKRAELRAILRRDPTDAELAEAADVTATTEDGGQFGGTGFSQQAANQLITLGNKVRTGQELTDEEKATYSISYMQLTAPRVTGSPQTGFSIVEPQLDQRLFPLPEALGAPPLSGPQGPGETPQAAPGQPQGQPEPSTSGQPTGARVTPLSQRQPPERAGRTAMMQQGTQSARNIREQIVRPDGTIDRFKMGAMIFNVPGTQGRTLRAQFEDAAAAKLRLETGATASETEVQNLMDRFMPSLFDNDETVADKLNRLTSFFEDSLKNTDPSLFNALIARAENIPDPPEDEPGSEFQGFDPETGLAVFKRPDGTFFGIAADAPADR